MTTFIHPTALVDPSAQLGEQVKIGAYSIIGPHVKIGDKTEIGPHVVIHGHTTLGQENRVFQFCSLGEIPQDKKYANEPTELRIGDRNVIREGCTFNIGTAQDKGITQVGNDNWIMAYVHIAHDCEVGDHVIFANNASLAGHVQIGDWVILGGFTTVHQFTTIGAHAMSSMASAIAQDVPPYVMVAGNKASPHGINSEGLKRRGFSAEALKAIKTAYKTLYRSGLSLEEARKHIEEAAKTTQELTLFEAFFNASTRGLIR